MIKEKMETWSNWFQVSAVMVLQLLHLNSSKLMLFINCLAAVNLWLSDTSLVPLRTWLESQVVPAPTIPHCQTKAAANPGEVSQEESSCWASAGGCSHTISSFTTSDLSQSGVLILSLFSRNCLQIIYSLCRMLPVTLTVMEQDGFFTPILVTCKQKVLLDLSVFGCGNILILNLPSLFKMKWWSWCRSSFYWDSRFS